MDNPVDIEDINRRIQEHVSQHGSDLPGDFLKSLSDLDHWVTATLAVVDQQQWVIRVVGIQKFKFDEFSPWPRTVSEAIYGPYTLDEAQELADRFGNTNPEWRVSVQKVYDPFDVVGLSDDQPS